MAWAAFDGRTIIAPLDAAGKKDSLSGEVMDRGDPIWIVNADHWPRAYLRAELI
jgi:hypothetical protein